MIEIKFEYASTQNEGRAVAFDGDKVIGECDFSVSDGQWVITHTEVEEEYGGQGIAAQLVDEVVQQARQRDVKIVPVCPYAKHRFERKPEYKDVQA